MYLGVDGGGTKTAFILIDDAGNIRAHHQTGGCYYLELSLPEVAALLAKGTAQILGQAGLNIADIKHAFFGLPAYGEDSSLLENLNAIPRSFLNE